MLGRDLRVVGEERRVVGLDDGELELEPFGSLKSRRPSPRSDSTPAAPSRLGPEVERVLGADAPDDAIGHSRRRRGRGAAPGYSKNVRSEPDEPCSSA